MKPTQQRAEEGEKLWAEPRPHLVIHGTNLETMARYAYNKQRHDKCVPYLPASRVTALELELERAKNALRKIGEESPENTNFTRSEDEAQFYIDTARAALRDLGEGQ